MRLLCRSRVSLRSTRATKCKIKRNGGTPADAVFHDPHQRVRRARSVARSPAGVPPRRLLQRTNTAAQFQNALPGTQRKTGVTRLYLSQSSDQVADRSSCRPGVFPEPPGSKGDKPSPAGTALAPPAVSPARRPCKRARRRAGRQTHRQCQRFVRRRIVPINRGVIRDDLQRADVAPPLTNNKETKKIRNAEGQTRTALPSTTRTWTCCRFAA